MSTTLQLHHRPWAVFDPHDPAHRTWYHDFVQHNTWGKCPVRFHVPEGSQDLITTIQRQLVEYYVQQEFKQ